jgi:cobalt/nickel transport system permease protein
MLITSLNRANSYYNAMEARGYDGEFMFLEEDKKVYPIQIVLAGAFVIFLVLLWSFTR